MQANFSEDVVQAALVVAVVAEAAAVVEAAVVVEESVGFGVLVGPIKG